MFDSVDLAITALNDENLSEKKREEAVRFLEKDASPAAINALISALRNRDAGIRWVASQSLALLGEKAIKPLLLALTKPDADLFFFESARPVFLNNSSERVKLRSKALVAATHKIGANVLVMQEANKLLLSDW
jgi:HEAT repeat protein